MGLVGFRPLGLGKWRGATGTGREMGIAFPAILSTRAFGFPSVRFDFDFGS
jgi:hypothetical protein